MPQKEKVVLVSPKDEVLGTMEKLEAHQKGVLHRAFSVFIFNKAGQMLLQQRASEKYHSSNLWTNACCSHPRENESYLAAAHRRISEELGIQTELEEKFHFIYQAEVGNDLIEHELDHVFVGEFNAEIPFNSEEVKAVEWKTIAEVQQEIQAKPEIYTAWFKIIFEEYLERLAVK